MHSWIGGELDLSESFKRAGDAENGIGRLSLQDKIGNSRGGWSSGEGQAIQGKPGWQTALGENPDCEF